MNNLQKFYQERARGKLIHPPTEPADYSRTRDYQTNDGSKACFATFPQRAFMSREEQRELIINLGILQQ